MEWIKADDGNGRTFSALTEHPNPPAEEHVKCWVFIDKENGWGKNLGEVAYLELKKADSGFFMS